MPYSMTKDEPSRLRAPAPAPAAADIGRVGPRARAHEPAKSPLRIEESEKQTETLAAQDSPSGADEDLALCRRAMAGSEEAFRELVERHQHSVFTFCLRLLGDRGEAEDTAQEVFLTIFEHLPSFRGEARFRTWALKIARNQSLNRLKYLERRGRRKSESFSNVSEEQIHRESQATRNNMPDASIEANERTALVRSAIADLAVEQRAVVLLRDVEDLSYEEVAEVTGLPVGTVKSRIHRGRSILARKLGRLSL